MIDGVSRAGGLNILSIQSSVAYGHVGNSAAVFPLQRLGIEVWPVNTVHFSNHTGYGEWRGPVLAAGDVEEVLRGIGERGVLGACDAVLSGYMGDVSLGEVILGAVGRVREANPRALFCCDPVMGDEGRGFFVRPGIPEFMRERAVPAADVVTPNQFELEYLAGAAARTLGDALAAAEAVMGLGPGTVLVTSLRRRDAGEGRIEMLAATREGAWLVGTPLLPLEVNGAGDATAALFLGHLLLGRGVEEALSLTASSVHAVLEKTFRRGTREIQLVAAQESLVSPPVRFPARRVS
ncbi:pyridoxal kinase PdxY [Rubrobacter xylanophilus]|uniref:Pyridoxal kinase PdxY n=1 Tax=Rubrobacter xylanophilus TaxID=49319 RepID=A0A510HMP4_9ACTN|nr:pyridoxal kinase PdxY [Rubrobacter xylanophilus]BBL81118.1 pyridoxal kinase PdxY [Rubrobacter xylanophilus]